MQFPDFTRELQVPQPSPLWGVTPFYIVAVHRWKYADTTYLDFVKEPEIVESRKPTKIQTLRANHSLPLPSLSQFQHSILIACNLGDMFIRKNERLTVPDTFYIEFKQGWKNKAYMQHLLASFEGYQSSKDLVFGLVTKYNQPINSKGRRKGSLNLPKEYYFQTVTDYIWEWYHEQVYILEVTQRNKVGKGNLPKDWTWNLKKKLKKTIPTNLDVYFQDAEMNVVLAYLYIDDGTYQQWKNKDSLGTTVFCLNDYPRSDLLRLSEYLNNRFDWKTTVRKKRQNNATKKWGKKTNLSWELTIPADNRQDFFTRIYPHVIPHFFYKLPVQFRTYTVKHTDGTKEVKFWPQINKNLPSKVHVRKDRKQWQNSRKELRDWVFKECKSLTTPEKKISSLQIWKKLNSKPRSPYWSPVAFELDGQWYSVDVKKARNLIEEEKGQ